MNVRRREADGDAAVQRRGRTRVSHVAGRLAGVATGVSLIALPTTPAGFALPDPAEPYIDKYGGEICQGLDAHPDHGEVLRAIATVRDYVHLSDEDAEIVVVRSIEAICPQYASLITVGEPPPIGPG